MEQSAPPYFVAPDYSRFQRRKQHQHTSGAKRMTSGRDVRRRTLEYLCVCRNPEAYKAVIKSAPDTVVKTICNAALNVQRGGSVKLTNTQKALFRKHRSAINRLVSKKVSIASKKKLLGQRGGAFWIPALIGAAATALGSALFGNRNTQ
jgi:hypothetical protein